MGHNKPEGQATPIVSGDKLHKEIFSAKPFEGAVDSNKPDSTRLKT